MYSVNSNFLKQHRILKIAENFKMTKSGRQKGPIFPRFFAVHNYLEKNRKNILKIVTYSWCKMKVSISFNLFKYFKYRARG